MSLPQAGLADALPDFNLSPLISTIGLPNAQHGADLVERGHTRWRSSIVTASHSTEDTDGNESLLFDGETTVASLGFDYGLRDRLQIGVELPYVLHESGGLDSFIDSWHDWFGLPDGIRTQIGQDQLNFIYQVDGNDLLNFGNNQRGIGDLRLTAAWQLREDPTSSTALRAMIKLPTGDSDRLTGSGAADVSLGVAGDYRDVFDSSRWSGFYRAHAILVGEPNRLADRARPVIGVLAGGLSAKLGPRVELTVQGTLRSAAYDSSLRMLGEPSLLLEIGGTILVSERLRLAIAVGEDIYVESAPDVSFALSLIYAPSANQ